MELHASVRCFLGKNGTLVGLTTLTMKKLTTLALSNDYQIVAPPTDQQAFQSQIILDNLVDLSHWCKSFTLPLWVCGFSSWLSARPSTLSMLVEAN